MSTVQIIGVGNEIAVDGGRKFNSDLNGLVVRYGGEL
jgi:hypothetical protein